MLTNYDIEKISAMIVRKLTTDDKFMSRMSKMLSKQKGNLINSARAAEILGVNRKTVCEIAPFIGGVKGKGKSSHWMFPQEGLIERYVEYKNQ
jgi:hypothetical protein